MKEFIKEIIGFWNNYWGDSFVPGFCWQQWCTSYIPEKKGKHQICSLVSGSGFGSVFLPGNGKDHTGVYWRDCILAGPLAGSIYSGDRFRHDRIFEGEKCLPQRLLLWLSVQF